MIFEDDRTEEQKKTHSVLIAATDSFLSGWGSAEGGASMCAWAVKPEDADDMEYWVEKRSDMKRVRRVGRDWKPYKAAHAHIYVADRGTHPALRAWS